MKKSADFALLARYLSGAASPSEEKVVESWRQASAENERMFVLMQTAWETPEREHESSNLDLLWHAMVEKAGLEQSAAGSTPSFAAEQTRRTQPWRGLMHPDNYHRVLRYVALFVAVLGIGYVAGIFDGGSDRGATITLTVPYGQRDSVVLDDGSRVALDAGSSLRYARDMAGELREVFLTGEGYFEVASDPRRPFVVHANHARVQVVGTKFNVRAWQPDNKVTVAVTEGRVALGADRENGQSVLISGGQASAIRTGAAPDTPRAVDTATFLGWMQNEVTFEDAPLREILAQLERWYDVRFQIPDRALAAERLNLQLKSESLSASLELLSALTDLDYVQEGKSVLLQKRQQ